MIFLYKTKDQRVKKKWSRWVNKSMISLKIQLTEDGRWLIKILPIAI